MPRKWSKIFPFPADAEINEAQARELAPLSPEEQREVASVYPEGLGNAAREQRSAAHMTGLP
jgi:hypothetical protein